MNKQEQLKRIKLLALDFDGIMTDGHVYVTQSGEEAVRCSRRDGLGIEMLKNNNLEVVVISKEINPVVTVRCRKLKIICWQGIKTSEGKLEILKRVIKKKGISLSEVAYMGDDLNDYAVLKAVGLAITVSDAHKSIIKIADIITKACGGQHAVREVSEMILKVQNKKFIF